MHQTDNFDASGRVESEQVKTSSLAQFPQVFFFSVTEHLNSQAKCGVPRSEQSVFVWKFHLVTIVGRNNLGFLKDSNPVAHSVNSNIFYAVIHRPACSKTFISKSSDLRAPFPPQMIFCPSTGLVYLVH